MTGLTAGLLQEGRQKAGLVGKSCDDNSGDNVRAQAACVCGLHQRQWSLVGNMYTFRESALNGSATLRPWLGAAAAEAMPRHP